MQNYSTTVISFEWGFQGVIFSHLNSPPEVFKIIFMEQIIADL